MTLHIDSINGKSIRLIIHSQGLTLPDQRKDIKIEIQQRLQRQQHHYVVIDKASYMYRTASSKGVSFATLLTSHLKAKHFDDRSTPTTYLVFISMDRQIYLAHLSESEGLCSEQVGDIESIERYTKEHTDLKIYYVDTSVSLQRELLEKLVATPLVGINLNHPAIMYRKLNEALWHMGIRLPRLTNWAWATGLAFMLMAGGWQLFIWFKPKVEQSTQIVKAVVIDSFDSNASSYVGDLANFLTHAGRYIPFGYGEWSCEYIKGKPYFVLGGTVDDTYRDLIHFMVERLEVVGRPELSRDNWKVFVPFDAHPRNVEPLNLPYAPLLKRLQTITESLHFDTAFSISDSSVSVTLNQDYTKINELAELSKRLMDWPMRLESCHMKFSDELIQELTITFNLEVKGDAS